MQVSKFKLKRPFQGRFSFINANDPGLRRLGVVSFTCALVARLFGVRVFVLTDLQVERCGDMPHQRVEYRSAVALLHFLVEDVAGSDVEPLVFSPERNAFIGTHDRVAFAELGLCARARGVDGRGTSSGRRVSEIEDHLDFHVGLRFEA